MTDKTLQRQQGFEPGDRVRHRGTQRTGTLKSRIKGGFVVFRVDWDDDTVTLASPEELEPAVSH